MKFYDMLQLDPSMLKPKIKESKTAKEKWYFIFTLIVRALLIVCFATLFIGVLSNIFGAENAPMAVVLFVIMLSIRFVNFRYCIQDSLVTLAIVLLILLFVPILALILPPYLLFFLYF